MLNPYQIIGVLETAGDEEIQNAYHALLREYSAAHHEQQLVKIQQAYGLIKDSDARVRYRLFHVEPMTPEMINQSFRQINQDIKRVDLKTFQAVLKLSIAKLSLPPLEKNTRA